MAKKTIKQGIRVMGVLLACWAGVADLPARADTSDWNWVTSDNLTQPRSFHSALEVELQGGGRGVMVIGGMTNEKIPTPLHPTDLYDPEINQWSSGPSLITARAWQTTTAILPTAGSNRGKVLVTGGFNGNESIGECELLDPKMEGDPPGFPALKEARDSHLAVELPDGRVLVAGGEQYVDGRLAGILKSSEVYDPAAPTDWASTGDLKQRRFHPTAVVLKTGPHQGKVLVVGGFDVVGKYPDARIPALKSCEVYHPAKDSKKGYWEEVAPLKHPRGMHTLTLLKDGRVLAAGGVNELGGNAVSYRSYEIYDPRNNKWTCPTDDKGWDRLRQYRSGHTATLLDDNTTLLVSGYTSEIYDPEKKTWTFTGDTLRESRTGHTATLLTAGAHKGEVVVAGGLPKSSEIFQPPSTLRHTAIELPGYRKNAEKE